MNRLILCSVGNKRMNFKKVRSSGNNSNIDYKEMSFLNYIKLPENK